MSLESFGQRVKELRKANGFSQEEFAKVVGIHRTYVAGIESGKRNVSLENIEKISSALGMSLPEFFAYDTIIPQQIIYLNVNGEQFALKADKSLTRDQKNYLEALSQYCYEDYTGEDAEGGEDISEMSNFELADWFINKAKVELGVTLRYIPIDEEYRIQK